MPELPDLTIFAENLHKSLKGKRITAVNQNKNARANVSPEQLADSLTGNEVVRVERLGKEVRFEISNGDSLQVHLMLTGGFLLSKNDTPSHPAILKLTFHDGSSLVVTDPKGLARVSLNPPTAETAPDALDVTAKDLTRFFRKKPKVLAKAFLIDQKILRGIGNAYADEILWEAKISPKSPVGKIPPDEVESLADAIISVLLEATDYLRKHHPGIISGEIRDFLKVHTPSRSLSPTGHPIIKELISSKTTYFTEEQKLYT